MASLEGAFARVQRAGEHLDELAAIQRQFVKEYADRLVFHQDAVTHVIKARWLGGPDPAVKPSVSILLGETTYNLRAALDYLVYELALLDSGVPQEGTQFPIFYSLSDFNTRGIRQLVGLLPRHVACIEQLQPYNGYEWPCVLREISNPDKHKGLIVAQSSMSGGFNILFGTPEEGAEFMKTGWEQHPEGATTLPVGSVIPDEPKEGEGVYVKVQTTFDITTRDGSPVVRTLRLLASEVRLLLELFDPEFKGC